jgi:glycosyltransferase involved in cell wall biosynthesis
MKRKMNWNAPKISVVVPTYNRANMIGGCIEAILSQTMNDFEVIVVSDGSTDNTRDVVNKFDDPRVLFFEKENGGQASARNLGIVKSNGEYISLCDDDDRFHADHLMTLSAFLDGHRGVGLAYSDALWAYEDGSREPEVRFSQNFDKKSLENFNYITPLNVMFRKSCLQNISLFNENLGLKGLEDWDFFLRLSDHYPFHHIKKVTSQYTVHEENSFRPNSGYNYVKASLLVRVQRFKHLLSEYGVHLFDHVNHMYPFYLIQCHLDNGKACEAMEIGYHLYKLFKVYTERGNNAQFTELFILFSLGISSFALRLREDAQLFIESIAKYPSFDLIKSQFTAFVRQYIAMTLNRDLKELLTGSFQMGLAK